MVRIKSNSLSRRKAIKSTGTLAAFGLFSGSGTAEKQGMTGSKEVGLHDEITNLLAEGQISEARDLAERHDIGFSESSPPIESHEPSSPTSHGMSIENRNSQTSSSFSCFLTLTEGDVWTATGNAFLEGQVLRLSSPHRVDDICGFSFDNSNWSALEQSKSNTFTFIDNDAVDVDYDQYEANGVTFTIDEPLTNHEFYVSVQTELIHESDDDRHGVQFSYEHVYSRSSGVIEVDEILPKAIKAILPSGANSWKEERWVSIDGNRS